jgi:hypothetical protein
MRTQDEIRERIALLVREAANLPAQEDAGAWTTQFINKLVNDMYQLCIDEIEARRRV